MTRSALQVLGGAQLRRTLKAAGLDVQDLKDTHAQVAKLVENQARPETPTRSGRLKRSLRSSGTQGAAIVRAGTAAVPYAGPIHWGWESRHITAQPWIWKEAQDDEPQWMNLYLHGIETIISKIEGVPYP